MPHELIDTNVIIRYLVEDPNTTNGRFKGVYRFFSRLEEGKVSVFLADLVLFQSYFVLTSYYRVPSAEAAAKLQEIVAFKGIRMAEKQIIVACLKILQSESIDIVDAYRIAFSRENGLRSIYIYDSDLKKRGLRQLKIE